MATAGEWPWMASLQKNGSHVCGATLVAVDSVLSNGNCFSSSPVASDWTVVLGRLKQNGSNTFEQRLNVINITLSNRTGSNIAVLKLSARPTLSDYIQPICLDEGQTVAVGTACWAAGWSSGRGGVEQVLQEIQTSVADCGNASSSNTICTGTFTLEQGDFGGPLMCQLKGSWVQVSTLSLQSSSTRRAREAVMMFTRLSAFREFLTETLGMLLSPASTTTVTTTTSTSTTSITTGGALAPAPFFLLLHLLVLASCLQLFL